ncbi:MAG: hypothetical protein ACRCUT_10275, partial [Spirochaetota bacterium]
DLKNQTMVLDRVHQIVQKRNLTLLMTVHDPNLAVIYADKLVMLNGGSVIACGKPASTVTTENLRTMYGSTVTVFNWRGTKIVHPGKRKCSKQSI